MNDDREPTDAEFLRALVGLPTNFNPKQFRPFCNVCGWRKGGIDSWSGTACKCGHSEPVIEMVKP